MKIANWKERPRGKQSLLEKHLKTLKECREHNMCAYITLCAVVKV